MLEDEKEYSSQSVWRETWGSYAQVSGAVTHNQLQRQKKKKLYGLFIWGKCVLSATGRSAVYGLLHSKEEASDPGQQKPGSLRIHKEGA